MDIKENRTIDVQYKNVMSWQSTVLLCYTVYKGWKNMENTDLGEMWTWHDDLWSVIILNCARNLKFRTLRTVWMRDRRALHLLKTCQDWGIANVALLDCPVTRRRASHFFAEMTTLRAWSPRVSVSLSRHHAAWCDLGGPVRIPSRHTNRYTAQVARVKFAQFQAVSTLQYSNIVGMTAPT